MLQIPGLSLELLPKIDGEEKPEGVIQEARDNLLVMLALAGDVPLWMRDLAGLGTRRDPLLETLILLFARRLREELLRGLDRDYIHRVDDLGVIRGKLVIGQHLARNSAHRERFTCAFDELSENTFLNRVLKAACRILIDQTRSSKTHQALSHCLMLFDDVADEPDARPLLDRVVLNRKNERFADILAFSRLILLQVAPTGSRGKEMVFSLLFDMDRVFEGFIGAMIQRAARKIDPAPNVYLQARAHRRYLMKSASGSGVVQLRPDVLVEYKSDDGAQYVVIDTKWKRSKETRQAGIGASDYYQLYAYTRRYGANRGVLLLPRMGNDKTHLKFHPLSDAGEPDDTEVVVSFINLHRNLRSGGELQKLETELMAVVAMAEGREDGEQDARQNIEEA